MMIHRSMPRHRLALAAALLLAGAGSSARAKDRSFACAAGNWNTSGCWSPTGVPKPGDSVRLGNVLVTMDKGVRADLAQLTVRSANSALQRVLQLVDGSLATQTLQIDQGLLDQAGGSVQAGSLAVGGDSPGDAAYRLGGGTLQTASVTVGAPGGAEAMMFQAGGEHRSRNLLVTNQGGLGRYVLDAGTLTVTETTRVGGANVAGLAGSRFDHSGGKFITTLLSLGHQGSGLYTLTGSAILQADRVELGWTAGTIGQLQLAAVSGAADIGSLLVGRAGNAGVMLVEGQLQTGGVQIAGGDGMGQSQGVHNTGQLVLAGSGSGRVGRYQLSGGLLQSTDVLVGLGEGAGELLHTGGEHLASGVVRIAATGLLRLQNQARLQLVDGSVVRNSGRLELLGGRIDGDVVNDGQLVIGSAGPRAPVFNGHLLHRGQVVLNSDVVSFQDGLQNEVDWPTLASGRALSVGGRGLDNRGTLRLEGGALRGDGALLNSGLVSGWGRLDGSAAFTNAGLLRQDGGALVLANGSQNLNTGHWQLQAGRRLVLDGADASLHNLGLLALDGASVTGSGRLRNLAGGVVSGGGTLASRFDNAGTVALQGAEHLALAVGATSSGLIDLRGAATLLHGAALANRGLLAGHGRVSSVIDNTGGALQAQGGVLVLAAPVQGAGRLIAAGGATLLLQHTPLPNTGIWQLDGGTLAADGQVLSNQHLVQGHGSLRAREVRNAGAMHFSGGPVQLFGSVHQQAGASLVVSGGSVASVHGSFDAAAGSQTRVSDGSQLVFFGTVSQHVGASFSGGGRFLFEGGVSVGDSPGAGGVAGDAVLGQDNLFRAELAGLAPGTGFDHFTVSGHLQMGGTLQLSLLNGFAPQAGQRFDLFDWGSRSGSFAQLDLAAAPLAPGLRWDTSQLHIDGSLAVAAVPEPAHWALLASGLAVLFGRRRTWRAAT